LARALSLVSVEEARARMLAPLRPLRSESVALADAIGRTLAEDVQARRSQPPFRASAMDGWALAAASTPGALQVVGESAAGHGFAGTVGPGQAVRIFTGAAVPQGADAVVIQEQAKREGERVTVPAAPPGENIRSEGLDFRKGDLLIRLGARLDPWRLALAASAGYARLAVSRRPKVAILPTGEEIVPPGGDPGPFQIYNSGSAALGALVRAWGGEALDLDAAGDDADAIASAAQVSCDLLVTLGGASVGDHDLVKPALTSELGLALAVDGVNLRPGKPTWFGKLEDGAWVLGLPGNPASALVCAELFLRPLLMSLQGADPQVRLVAGGALSRLGPNGPREHWMRARLALTGGGALTADPLPDQDSSLVTVFAEADALLRRAPGAPAAQAGDIVELLILERLR
jgi:molybdopterin molybdotransferase